MQSHQNHCTISQSIVIVIFLLRLFSVSSHEFSSQNSSPVLKQTTVADINLYSFTRSMEQNSWQTSWESPCLLQNVMVQRSCYEASRIQASPPHPYYLGLILILSSYLRLVLPRLSFSSGSLECNFINFSYLLCVWFDIPFFCNELTVKLFIM